MAFLVSPGVQVRETDLTNIIPAVSTSIGGFAGRFKWGPANEVTTVSSEADLIAKFGYPVVSTNPASHTRDDWYAAANFLGYTNNLRLVRVLPDAARNSVSEPTGTIRSEDRIALMIASDGSTPVNTNITVEYYLGSSVTISIEPSDSDKSVRNKVHAAFNAITPAGSRPQNITTDDTPAIAIEWDADGNTVPVSVTRGGFGFTYSYLTQDDGDSAANIANEDDFLTERGTLLNGTAYSRYLGHLGNDIGVILIDAGMTTAEFNNSILFGTTKPVDLFDTVPGQSAWAHNNGYSALQDEVHVVVYTTGTDLTGNEAEVLEVWPYLSKAKNGKTADGAQNYYVDVINTASQYIYLLPETNVDGGTPSSPRVGAGTTIGTPVNSTTPNFAEFITNDNTIATRGLRKYNLSAGTDGAAVTDADYTSAYDLLGDVEQIDVSLLFVGRANQAADGNKVVQKYVIDLAEKRKDCVAFVSPDYNTAVVNPTAAKVVDYFNATGSDARPAGTTAFNSTSYAVFDSGWKRQYDRYNDEYFWAPLNADIAGISARTDYTNDAWWSPAGLNRGFIQNVVKLSFNPNQTDRDTLYPLRVNPVVTFRGQGTILYGDKTALSRPSAFDRINVRRLFIVLEKAIATAARYQLFEFNDEFTRANFVAAIEPFLQDVRSRRGLTDFRVVCDASNNTPQVIDTNRFVADIYIKPNRSINFITLNFIAVRSGVSFEEVAGA